MIQGFYYLHVNGDLIYKRGLEDTSADLRESDFVKAFWPFDPTNRLGAWLIAIEALALGNDTTRERVDAVADLWELTNDDAQHLAEMLNLHLERDGDRWFSAFAGFQNLQESTVGFGETCLEAFADLAKNAEIRRAKTWGAGFDDAAKAALG